MAQGDRTWAVIAILISLSLTPSSADGEKEGALPWEVTTPGRLPWEGLENDLDALLRVQVRKGSYVSSKGVAGLLLVAATGGGSAGLPRPSGRATCAGRPGLQSQNARAAPAAAAPPRLQARDNAVSLVVFNEGFYAVTLNCLVSMVRFGRLQNIIVTAAGRGSLVRCKQLRLPCYDAADLLRAHGGRAAEGDARRNSPEWYQLVWVKTLIAHAAIKRGYDVLFAGGRSAGWGPGPGLWGRLERARLKTAAARTAVWRGHGALSGGGQGCGARQQGPASRVDAAAKRSGAASQIA
jgi:hypothetical protein